MNYYVHFIHEESGAMVAQRCMVGLPGVGDDLRLSDARYFRITRRIFCLDETRSDKAQRVNVGVIES